MADGTSFSIDLDVQGTGGVQSAATSLASLSDRLTMAGSAATKASDAVKSGEAAYRQTEITAERAAKALEKITLAADAQRGKLAKAMEVGDDRAFWRAAGALQNLEARQAEAVVKSEAAKAAMNAEAASLDTLKASSSAAAAEQNRLSQSIADARTQADAMTATLAAVKASNDALAKSFVSSSLASIKASKDELAAKTASMDAVKAMDKQLLDSFLRKSNAEVKATKAAADARSKAAGVATGSRQVNEIAEAFGKLGGPLGAVGSQAFGAAEGVKKLVGSLGTTLGPIALAAVGVAAVSTALIAGTASILKWSLGLSDSTGEFDKLSKKFSSNIGKLFGSLKIDGFVKGLTKIVDLFDETSVTGKAIKVVFSSIFQPLLDGLTDLLPAVVSTFIQFEIWALKGLIAIKPYGSTIMLIVQAFGVLAVAVGVAVGFVVGLLVGVAAELALVVAAGLWLNQTFEGVGKSIREFFSGLSLEGVGTQIIEGLANGIIAGNAAVFNAISGVVTGAIASAKSLLGIASPSKVFAEIGSNTAAGMAGGVEDGTDQVQGSLETMVSPPASSAVGGVSAGNSGGGNNTYYLSFQIADGGSPTETARAARDAFIDFFDGIAVQAGTEVPT